MKAAARAVRSLLLSAVALIELFNGVTIAVAEPIPIPSASPVASPIVDLSYATYQGSYDATTNINTFKGIRYAAPPVGKLRWQAPTDPVKNKSVITPATADPPICPQSGAAGTPAVYGFNSGPGNEDCLYLNVFAPPNAKNLPVFFWIHGGGYALFSAEGLDPSPMMNRNGNNFVTVVIQYRLGAFGFLSSSEVKDKGVVNAGLLDMNFALQWVQKYISKFGGDPTRVTIGGESAGAGAVMFQSMAYGGNQEPKLFHNVIAASTWVPTVYNYDDPVPTQNYEAFAAAAGCGSANNTFNCLVAANTSILQAASGTVSTSGAFGTFAFLPVVDRCFIEERPTVQLLQKRLNAKRVLSGNNANEGVPLSPPTVKTLSGFLDYVATTFPSFSTSDVAGLQAQYSYPGDTLDTDPSAPVFDTLGDSGPTSVNQSGFATGQQQRLFDVYAESTYVCPSYWLAEAFPQAWKYQYSVVPAYHGADLTAYWSKGAAVPGTSFIHAFQKIWGNFITTNSPVISVADATDGLANATVPVGAYGQINWPQYSLANPKMMSLNETGGTVFPVDVTADLKYTVLLEPGITNSFKLVDAYKWEGGRGERCQWWRSLAAKIPV
ncbi:carboxylesterase [Lepidopterella palustris CBS 459.81]|uniref:Carboxylic ester hydrolase n=1 Tax=Lepidopterella palustris CBS 459.81 TaxID=1314670 RepID=A0A8E2E9C3_9PEZI|nr:carboxylesterase [Lepidopterella palustris CBS 459.81]